LDGLRYLGSRPGHPSLLVLSLLVNLCLVPAFAMMPLLIKEWEAGPMQLGWMNSSLGIGMIAGGITLGVWGGFKTKIYTTLLGLMVLGLATTSIGTVPPSALYGIAAIFAVGVAVPIVNGPIQAVLQATVAPKIQGRIFTLYGSLAGLSAPVGLVLAVPIAEGLGIRMTYWCSGALCCVLALCAWFVPALLSIEQRSDGEPEQTDAVNGDAVHGAGCAAA
jgi:DHA3 family macrolide efflux protein-like MFS transporter